MTGLHTSPFLWSSHWVGIVNLGQSGVKCTPVWQFLQGRGRVLLRPRYYSWVCLLLKQRLQRCNSLALCIRESELLYLWQCKDAWFIKEQNIHPLLSVLLRVRSWTPVAATLLPVDLALEWDCSSGTPALLNQEPVPLCFDPESPAFTATGFLIWSNLITSEECCRISSNKG